MTRALLPAVIAFVAGLALGWCLGTDPGLVKRCRDGHVSIVREGEALVVRCAP